MLAQVAVLGDAWLEVSYWHDAARRERNAGYAAFLKYLKKKRLASSTGQSAGAQCLLLARRCEVGVRRWL